MSNNKNVIKPQFFYNKNQEPSMVYLTINDYSKFMARLKRLSTRAKQQVQKNAKARTINFKAAKIKTKKLKFIREEANAR